MPLETACGRSSLAGVLALSRRASAEVRRQPSCLYFTRFENMRKITPRASDAQARSRQAATEQIVASDQFGALGGLEYLLGNESSSCPPSEETARAK